MRRAIVALVVLFALAACGGSAPQPTAQQVLDKFAAAGLEAKNIRAEERDPKSPLPNSYKDQLVFEIASVAPDGGQVFTCDTKANCDALFAYFDVLKALAGPYIYQSPSGMVVAQMNSGLTPEQAAKYEAVIKALP